MGTDCWGEGSEETEGGAGTGEGAAGEEGAGTEEGAEGGAGAGAVAGEGAGGAGALARLGIGGGLLETLGRLTSVDNAEWEELESRETELGDGEGTVLEGTARSGPSREITVEPSGSAGRVTLRFSGGGGVMGAARRAWKGTW